MKKELQGFGTRSIGRNLAECLKEVGKSFGVSKGVRPVGGNKGGVTSGGGAASGSPKMTRTGSGKGLCCGGKGPTAMPSGDTVTFKKVGKVSTMKLGGKDVREQP